MKNPKFATLKIDADGTRDRDDDPTIWHYNT